MLTVATPHTASARAQNQHGEVSRGLICRSWRTCCGSFHGACKAILDKMTPQSRIKLLANIDICCAETFWAAKDPKLKYGEQKIQELLLEKTQQYLAPLGLEGDEEKLKSLSGRAHWAVSSTPKPRQRQWSRRPQPHLSSLTKYPGNS